MELDKILDTADRAAGIFDRLVERIFIAFAATFGGWLTWTVLSAAELDLIIRLGGACMGALVCAALMWVFWFFGRFFA